MNYKSELVAVSPPDIGLPDLAPEFPDAFYNKGKLAEARGDKPAAKAAYEQAISLDEDYDDAKEALAALG